MKLDSKYNKRPDDPNFMDSKNTPLTESEATYYLKNAWKNIYGVYPSIDSLALLWAQSAGETGRWKYLRCNNWGNIKRRKDLKWTSYPAGEVLKGEHVLFEIYHPQTHFAAWDDVLEAAEYYIRFLSQRDRYKKAWIEVMAGDPVAYCRELKKAGYFTANLAHYTKGVVSLTNEFKRKANSLLSWAPQPVPKKPDTDKEPEELIEDKAPKATPEPKPELSDEPIAESPEKDSGLLNLITKIIDSLLSFLKLKR